MSEQDRNSALRKWTAGRLTELELKSVKLRLVNEQPEPGTLRTFGLDGSLCSGDSGGPVLWQHTIVGIVATGEDCEDLYDQESRSYRVEKSNDFHFSVLQGRADIDSLISAIDTSGIPLAGVDIYPKP